MGWQQYKWIWSKKLHAKLMPKSSTSKSTTSLSRLSEQSDIDDIESSEKDSDFETDYKSVPKKGLNSKQQRKQVFIRDDNKHMSNTADASSERGGSCSSILSARNDNDGDEINTHLDQDKDRIYDLPECDKDEDEDARKLLESLRNVNESQEDAALYGN